MDQRHEIMKLTEKHFKFSQLVRGLFQTKKSLYN